MTHTFLSPAPTSLLNSHLAYAAFNWHLYSIGCLTDTQTSQAQRETQFSFHNPPLLLFQCVLSRWMTQAAETWKLSLVPSLSPSVSIPLPSLRDCASALLPIPYLGHHTSEATRGSYLGYACVVPIGLFLLSPLLSVEWREIFLPLSLVSLLDWDTFG